MRDRLFILQVYLPVPAFFLENRMMDKKLILNGKTIGTVKDDCIVMYRNEGRHLYRVLSAWCLNIETVNCGVNRFIIEAGKTRYEISLDVIKKLRSKINLFVTFKTERQLAIPLKCWDRYEKPNISFPSYIGMSPDDFIDTCDGRWRSRLIAFSQVEIAF